MIVKKIDLHAQQLANLTFNLLEDCHQKEIKLARRYNLTTSEFHCLRLFGVDEVFSNKQLAERLKLSPGRLSRIISGLVDKGFMERNIHREDRRAMDVSLSPKGKRMVSELGNAYVTIHKEILKDIDPAIHEELIGGMTQLLSALRKWMNRS